MDKRFVGKHANRWKQHAVEQAVAEYWEQENNGRTDSRSLLGYLLSADNRGASPTDAEWLVASTLIQWLGSPIGRHFLAKLNRLVNAAGEP